MRGRLLIAAFCIAVATGCSGGSVNTTPVPTPVPTTAPTTAPVITSIAIATPAPGQTAAPVPVPAPSGYAQTVSLPFTNVPAGTTVSVTNTVGIPSNFASRIPSLSHARISAQSLRAVQDAAGFNTVLYDIVVPSATVTLGGAASTTFTLPASVAMPGTAYYLAFYDTTVASPAWNTISGPVQAITTTTGGTTVQFSGTLPSYTLTANSVYAVAVFSLASGTTPPPAAPSASPSPSPTPTAAPTTLAFIGIAGQNRIDAMTTSAVVGSINIGQNPNYIGMDNAGNYYVYTSPTGGAAAIIKRYPATAPAIPAATATSNANYTVSSTATGPQFMLVAGTGEVVIMSTTGTTSVTGTVTDIWDAGSSGGTPSRSITHSTDTHGDWIINGAVANNGTLYLTYSADAGVSYDVIPPGTSTPSRTFVESQVASANQGSFFPNFEAVADDGTLYVTVWTFNEAPETYAGLYTYLANGTEALPQPIPGGPQGVDVDGSGNVYVTVNNSSDNSGVDSSHQIKVYAPHAASLTRTITGTNWNTAYPITVGTDGTAFFSTYSPSLGIWSLLPGATTATSIESGVHGSDFVLYNGSRAIQSHTRSAQSAGGLGSGSHGSGTRRL